MKLIRLKINQSSGFRSLNKNFEIFFLRDFQYDDATVFNPYVLAGTNGSGKSNVLEALAEIFFHLDCIYLNNKPDYFDKSIDNPKGFDPKKSRVNAYELEYFTFLDKDVFPNEENYSQKAHIQIIKTSKNRPIITWLNKEEFNHRNIELNQNESKALLPEYVVGYASGNNETLSIPFFKSRFLQYDEYISNLAAREFVDPRPETSLVYLDEAFSQAILLTNLLMQERLEHEASDSKPYNILKPFQDSIGLKDVESFRLIIRTDIKVYVGKEFEYDRSPLEIADNNLAPLLLNLDLKSKDESSFVRSYLEKLKRCATSRYDFQNYDTYREDDDFEEHFDSRSYLILDYKVNQATKQAFQFHFENNPLKLFELLQLLLVLDNNVISIKKKQRAYSSDNIFINHDIHQIPVEEDRILRFKDFFLKKENLKKDIYTKALSDGEHQFLHALGLCLLFKDTRTLFLLDEPETHFNPDWKAKFISSIRNCFNKEEMESTETMREMLITTHSPFLISDSFSDYVLVFKKNENIGKVEEVKRPDFQTFGSSVNKIAIRVFEMPNTIGEYAQLRLHEFRKEFTILKKAEDMDNLIERVKKEMGDSVERVLFVNEVINKIESLK